jgi:hypothetical protein
VLVAAGAALLAVVLVVGLVGLLRRPDDATRQRFLQAVSALDTAPAVRYRQTLAGGAGSDVTATSGGEATGSVTLLGQRFGLLRAAGRTYVKTPSGLLPGGGSGSAAAAIAGRWVTGGALADSLPSADYPTPAELGQRLRDAVARTSQFPRAGDAVSVNGTTAWRAATPAGDLYVSAQAPYRVVRLVSSGGGGPTFHSLRRGTGDYFAYARAPRAPVPLATGQLDFPAVSDADVDGAFRELISQSGTLDTAVDTNFAFKLQGNGAFIGCGVASCTVVETITSSFSSTTAKPPPAVDAEMTVTMTGEGAPVGGCAATGSLPSNGTGQLSCTNTSPAWIAFYQRASRTPGLHPYAAQVVVLARAVSGAMVDSLIQKLLDEQEAYQRRAAPSRAPSATTSGTGKCDRVNRPAELTHAESAAERVSAAYSRPGFRTQNQTVAVLAVCVISTGQMRYYVAGRVDLEARQKVVAAGVQPPLKIVPNPGNALHAEPAAIGAAKADAAASPVNPVAIYATNPFCRDDPNCKTMIDNEPGSELQTPAAPRREVRAATFDAGTVWR